MNLKLKFMSGLKGPEQIEVPEGSSVNDVLQILDLIKKSGAVTVNEAVQVDRSAALKDGDEILILGLVGGG